MSDVRCKGAFPNICQHCSLTAPSRDTGNLGWPAGKLRENREEGGTERGKKAPFCLSEILVLFQTGKKGKRKKKERDGGEGGWKERNFPATSLLSAHCKVPAVANLAPALLSPLASASKFLTTILPAGNVNQDTFRIKKTQQTAPFSCMDYIKMKIVVLTVSNFCDF